MPVYNLIECSDNCSKLFVISRQYCRDVPPVDDDGPKLVVANATTDSCSLKDWQVKQATMVEKMWKQYYH